MSATGSRCSRFGIRMQPARHRRRGSACTRLQALLSAPHAGTAGSAGASVRGAHRCLAGCRGGELCARLRPCAGAAAGTAHIRGRRASTTVKRRDARRRAESFGLNLMRPRRRHSLAATGARRSDVGGVTYFGPGLKIALASQDDPTGIVSGLWKTLYSLDGSDFATYDGAARTDSLAKAPTRCATSPLDNVGNAETQHTLQFHRGHHAAAERKWS